MRPELLANPLFQKYYERWQEDEGSIVFAPMAEFLLRYKEFDRCIEVCRNGLKYHPQLITPRLTLAKAYVQTGETDKAREELAKVLQQSPQSKEALRVLEEIELLSDSLSETVSRKASRSPFEQPGYEVQMDESVFSRNSLERESENKFATLTMAKIYKAQGHVEKSRAICESILKREPQNSEALHLLSQLGST